MSPPILPGSTLGVLGSGQLGRMLALSARAMGYRVHTFSPEKASPTGQVADLEIAAAYDDLEAVSDFARGVDVVTFEFENVSAAAAAAAAEHGPVRPAGKVLHTTQNRLREKDFLSSAGFPLPPYAAVRSLEDLREALGRIGCPAVLKTAGFGYDGKGQVRIHHPGDASSAWEALTGQEAVLEAFVDFEREVSVVAARGLHGDYEAFEVVDNQHRNHILDVSVAPSSLSPEIKGRAVEISRGILEALDVVGVLCVELFVTRGGDLLVNEVAPRPHNSGHLTVDACRTSQFEQQLRAVCGLPLGSPDQLAPAAMANLLGDLWSTGEPHWRAALALPGVHLHLYGKKEPRPGRKMGHLTALAASSREAEELVCRARDLLQQSD
ncbi:MAG: 5-(carboxyamino)imidazole ribonucleotide synthase [Deltaproteobacteria bacterium]|nr:5-(carboxyamino)imidazole ribonucleotide synthase [Deltaproteobacteria bacterium]